MARSKKLTAAQRKRGIALWQACNAAHTAVFQGDTRITWNEAYKLAPADIRQAYADASRELRSYERELVNDGRGYFNNYGYFAETGHVLSPWI